MKYQDPETNAKEARQIIAELHNEAIYLTAALSGANTALKQLNDGLRELRKLPESTDPWAGPCETCGGTGYQAIKGVTAQ